MGVVGIAVAAVLAIVITHPKEGTIEWHKRGYQYVRDRAYGQTWSDRWSRWRERITGAQRPPPSAKEFNALSKKFVEHRNALLELGYLVERRFSISNPDVVAIRLVPDWKGWIPEENALYSSTDWSRDPVELIVIARPEDMPCWEEAVRKA